MRSFFALQPPRNPLAVGRMISILIPPRSDLEALMLPEYASMIVYIASPKPEPPSSLLWKIQRGIDRKLSASALPVCESSNRSTTAVEIFIENLNFRLCPYISSVGLSILFFSLLGVGIHSA